MLQQVRGGSVLILHMPERGAQGSMEIRGFMVVFVVFYGDLTKKKTWDLTKTHWNLTKQNAGIIRDYTGKIADIDGILMGAYSGNMHVLLYIVYRVSCIVYCILYIVYIVYCVVVCIVWYVSMYEM
jgi:hypothetical protein